MPRWSVGGPLGRERLAETAPGDGTRGVALDPRLLRVLVVGDDSAVRLRFRFAGGVVIEVLLASSGIEDRRRGPSALSSRYRSPGCPVGGPQAAVR